MILFHAHCLQFYEKLNHKFHVRYLIGKLKKLSYITRQTKKYFNNVTARSFYYSMVHSAVSYGLIVWGGVLMHGASANKLIRLYDKSIYIYNLFSLPGDAMLNVSAIYKRESLLKPNDIYKVRCCVTMFRIQYEYYAAFLLNDLSNLVRLHDYNTRHRNDYLLPLPNVRAVRLIFLYQGIKEWNELSQELRDSNSASSLQKRLTERILNQY